MNVVRRLLFALAIVCFASAGALWLWRACGGPGGCRGTQTQPAAVVIPAAELAQKLPSDPAVQLEALPNGFRYYLRPNGQPAHRLELRLVVNAGSVLEEDDQRGLAHFVEHMAFNGTTHFPKQEMAAFFASIGMRFGPSVNAETSYDETIYSLQVPTDSPAVVERALLILEDWAHGVAFDPVEVDKERGVIVEEWRMRRGAAARLQAAQFPILLKDSRYADRPPIGDMDVIRHFKVGRLKQFYTDWYRPDLMALVAVGDIQPAAFDAQVKAHFSRLPAVQNPKPRPTFDVPPQPGTAIGVATDQEAQGVSVAVYHKVAARPEVTIGDYRRSILGRLVASMISARLGEAAQMPGSPLVGAGASEGLLFRPLNATSVSALIRPDTVDQGLVALFGEFVRMMRFGFTVPEFERQKAVLLRNMERARVEADTRPSSVLAAEYTRNFTLAEPFPGLTAEADYTQRFLPSFSLDDVNELARNWIPDGNRVVLVTAPARAGQAIPTVERVAAAIRAAQALNLQPYVPPATAASLLDHDPAPGRVTATTPRDAVGVTEWTLSNGAKVVLKPTTFKEDEILFGAFAPGGTSLAADSDAMPAESSAQVVQSLGVGRLASGDLRRVLTGKAVAVRPIVGLYEVGLTGGSSQADLETLLQLVYLYMAEPRRDPSTFAAFLTQLRSALANQSATPDFAFNAALGSALSQGHLRARPMTEERLTEMDLDKSLAFYRARFSNASNFTFIFVGSLTPDVLRPLVEKYLASLPAGAPETWKDVGLQPPAGVVATRVERGLDPKGRTALVFSADQSGDDGASVTLRAMAEILENRLRTSLREELSGTYNVSVEAQFGVVPRKESRVSISFGSDPARADALVARVFAEIEKLRKDGVTPAELTNERQALLRDDQTSRQQNAYWMTQLASRYEFGFAPEGIAQLPQRIDQLTAPALKAMAESALNPARYVRVTLAPQPR